MKLLLVTVALSVAAVVAASCSPPQSTNTVAHVTTPIPVAIAPARTVELSARFEAGGTLNARTTALVSSRIVAPIAAVNVRAGDHVRRGQLLATLETSELSAQAARATSAFEAARQAGEAAAADAKSADASLELARAAHRRIVTLQTQNSATPQELDEAAATLGIAEARWSAAQSRVRESASSLDAARSAARAADVQVSYGSLVAPFEGVVTQRDADPGTLAAPGRTLFVIEDPAAYTLDVRLDASRSGGVHIDDAVSVQIGAGSADWIGGRVVEIARVDPTAQSFLAKISVAPASGRRSGLFGRARFKGDIRRTLVVPTTSVIRRGQLAFVFVATDQNIARLRNVSVGDLDDEGAEIVAGVVAGERIVVSPPPGLQDGAVIAPSAASSAERQPSPEARR